MATTVPETIWHRAITQADGRMVPVEPKGDFETILLECAGIVWPKDADNDVERLVQLKLHAPGDSVDGKVVDTHLATVSPEGRILYVVTGGYEKVPFKMILTNWLLELARAGGSIETLGTFDAGRNMFACMRVADPWRVPGDHSDMRPLFNVLSNHTGQGGIRGGFSKYRACCRNTSNMAAAEHDKRAGSASERTLNAWVTIAHRGNVEERIKSAVEWITDGRKRAESEKALLARLAAKVIAPQEVEKFVSDYIAIPSDATKRLKTVREKEREKFQTVLTDTEDLGNHELTKSGISAYGLLQAVSRYEDWFAPVRSSEDSPVGVRRAFRAFLGEREKEKATAEDRICELVGVRVR
jgi:hypothetical protein